MRRCALIRHAASVPHSAVAVRPAAWYRRQLTLTTLTGEPCCKRQPRELVFHSTVAVSSSCLRLQIADVDHTDRRAVLQKAAERAAATAQWRRTYSFLPAAELGAWQTLVSGLIICRHRLKAHCSCP